MATGGCGGCELTRLERLAEVRSRWENGYENEELDIYADLQWLLTETERLWDGVAGEHERENEILRIRLTMHENHAPSCTVTEVGPKECGCWDGSRPGELDSVGMGGLEEPIELISAGVKVEPMTEDQFIERVGEELVRDGVEVSIKERALWSQATYHKSVGHGLEFGPTLSQLLRAIYRVLQEQR